MGSRIFDEIRWGESIQEKTCQALRDLGWRDPNEVQDIRGGRNEAIATLVVNYGPEGKVRNGVITGSEPLLQMLVKVLTYYEQRLNREGGES